DPSAANDTGSAQAQVQILLPACGPDPNPAGFPVSDPHPEFLSLLQQLASMAPGAQQPTPSSLRTPANCSLSLNLSDNKGAPIDDCEVSTPATPKPCSVAIDVSIDQVGGSPPNTPSARLLPVAVSFLPPTLDFANDTAVPNGSINGNGSFRIRTDGGLGANGIGCVVDAVFPKTPAIEGGITPNVPDSNLNAALKDPNVWPNDLNAERAAVESALNITGLPISPVTLWSRSIIPMNIPGLSSLTLNVLTWRIDDPLLASITGAKWVAVAFPGDAVNPDPAGPSGGNPDFDEPPGLPLATCAPFGEHIEFSGMAGGVVARQCLSPAQPMVFSLLDPDAVNYTGDDGPRSDTSPCSVDADMDGLDANEEAYYGSNPLNPDSDADTLMDGSDNCPTVANPDQANFDGDGSGDACDPDVDGDGAANASDICPWTTPGQPADSNGCSQAQVDKDGDGACDPGAPSTGPAPGCSGTDNCPQDANSNQADFDGDQIGDTCDPDDDNDGVADVDEPGCGGDPYDAGKKPERLDLPGDENGDGSTTDALPAGSQNLDCDGDGYSGSVETHVFGLVEDQDACGSGAWPSDFVSNGTPNSTNKITVTDLTSFLAPVRRLDTSPGDPGYNVRWDLVPGKGVFAHDIAVNDLTALIAGSSGNPPMLNGVRAFNGPSCPWPP
ncbi:MAG TPA: thrombospondin type 3 repeat-containing protein, partial [Dehalococcoidia bacterium]|nr:thrombospondin type 3 repeat-containing protein [Dehalococcoidia bacterium]